MDTDSRIIEALRKGKSYREIAKELKTSFRRISRLYHHKKPAVRYVAFGDSHVPYEDKKIMKIIYDFIRREKPDGVIIMGDFSDFYQLSRFAKDPNRRHTLQDDLDKAVDYLEELRNIMGRRPIYYIMGNHEQRLERNLKEKSPEYFGLRCLSLKSLLELDRLNVILVPDRLELGDLTLIHGELVRKNAGYTARAHFDKYGTTMMLGHSHRDGKFTRRTLDGNKAVWENYCTCSLEPEYDSFPDWTHGFAVINFVEDTPFVEQVPIIGGRYFYGGKCYDRQEVSK